ncbi:polymer-forming cytoskeletal protein [bacterium]|nr:polymer-forming cytoskeletal protein [candidate division CSSED10-310 bacterium]
MLTIFRTPKSGKPDDQTPEQKSPYDREPIKPPQHMNSSEIKPQMPLSPTREMSKFQNTSSMNTAIGTTLIGKGLVFSGEVKGDGTIRVEGKFVGTLDVNNEVIIGSEGLIEGDIKAKSVSVLGKLHGNVNASEKITIDVSGSMIGDIVAPRVVVSEGAIYKGRIDMEPQSGIHASKREKTPDAKTPHTPKQQQPPKPASQEQKNGNDTPNKS